MYSELGVKLSCLYSSIPALAKLYIKKVPLVTNSRIHTLREHLLIFTTHGILARGTEFVNRCEILSWLVGSPVDVN